MKVKTTYSKTFTVFNETIELKAEITTKDINTQQDVSEEISNSTSILKKAVENECKHLFPTTVNMAVRKGIAE